MWYLRYGALHGIMDTVQLGGGEPSTILGGVLLLIKLDSRSREGLGISVSSVFSNSVQIRGPLMDPRIVPNSTGLAWRGSSMR